MFHAAELFGQDERFHRRADQEKKTLNLSVASY